MNRFSFLKFNRSQFVGLLVVGSSIGLAYASSVTLPNTFTAGTTASATAVNANFTAVKTAVDDNFSRLPRVWADTDNAAGGTFLTPGGLTEVNSVSINVPASGFITISGMAFINNNGAATDFILLPRVDGTALLGHAFLGFFAAGADAAPDGQDLGSLSYTITVPISAGAHTISHVVGPSSGTANFFYNKNSLTVVYYPASQGSVTPPITPLKENTVIVPNVRPSEDGR